MTFELEHTNPEQKRRKYMTTAVDFGYEKKNLPNLYSTHEIIY